MAIETPALSQKGWDIATMTGQGDQRDSDSRQKLLRLMMSALSVTP
jgi:hypothetical protein